MWISLINSIKRRFDESEKVFLLVTAMLINIFGVSACRGSPRDACPLHCCYALAGFLCWKTEVDYSSFDERASYLLIEFKYKVIYIVRLYFVINIILRYVI